jgi:hypothetical protein
MPGLAPQPQQLHDLPKIDQAVGGTDGFRTDFGGRIRVVSRGNFVFELG